MTAIQKINQLAQIASKYQKEAHQKYLNLTLAQVTSECKQYGVKAAELTAVYQQQMAQAEIEAAELTVIGQIPERDKQNIIKSLRNKKLNMHYFFCDWQQIARNMWTVWNFQSEQECWSVIRDFITAVQIRTYCRRNGLTTCKGSYHSFDCRNEHGELWGIASSGNTSASVNGVRWHSIQVDGLKNLQIWFV